MVKRAFSFLLFSILLSQLSFAGTTGKLAGYIKDGETNQPMISANDWRKHSCCRNGFRCGN
ncbi:MAG: hypothetical protein M1480_01925 [Bacteroidetes bacterium]|nr:hypothetical protein [Bacteroidota bacterium]